MRINRKIQFIVMPNNRRCSLSLTAWLGLLCEEAGSVSRESSGCSVRVRTRGGAFMFSRSAGGTDWIRSKSLGRGNRGSPSLPVDERQEITRTVRMCSTRWCTVSAFHGHNCVRLQFTGPLHAVQHQAQTVQFIHFTWHTVWWSTQGQIPQQPQL